MSIAITYKESVVKPLEKWTSRDFIKYYFNKLAKLENVPSLTIPPEAWLGFGSRIKGFQRKLTISNHQYKQFIDTVFDKVFSQDGYQPVFGCIVSEKIYFLVQKMKSSTHFDNSDFENLKKELYKDESLFKKMQLKLSDD